MRDDLVERVVLAIRREADRYVANREADAIARRIIPIVMEDAAKVIEDGIPMPGEDRQVHGTYAQGVFDAAQSIRSLVYEVGG